MRTNSALVASWIDQAMAYNKPRRVRAFPFLPEYSALLVIDMQRYFIDPISHASFQEAEGIIENVRKLVWAFSEKGLPVIYTWHALKKGEDPGIMGRWWGDAPSMDDPLSAIDPRLDRPGSIMLRKTRYSAFAGTDLDKILTERKVRQLVITGLMTHLCCETTAREAFVRDYEVFFVVDGTATKDPDLHMGSLRSLSDGFAILTKTEEIVGCM